MSGGERQIEMTWRCSACAHRNLGRHMVCQRCGDPKDEREPYEMPSDVEAAPTVTDPELLRMAHAGANWRCRYCGSDQRALGGGCARCGAGRAHAQTGGRRGARTQAPLGCNAMLAIAATVFAALVIVLLVWMRPSARPMHAEALPRVEPREIYARVTGVSWSQTTHLDRWSVLDGEGFAESKPADAFDVKTLGPRVHHYDKVLDHYDAESYTEQVPDGFDTQTYTERVACGQDCTPSAPSCRQVCTSNKNGFATCRQECTPNAPSCATRYCDVPRTRQVPRTKTVAKTRQIPRYRDEPRMAAYFAWHVWGWKEVKSETATGTTLETRWPSLAVDADAGVKERERRLGRYRVSLVDYAERPHEADIADERAFAAMAVGSWHVIRADDPSARDVRIADD